MALGFASNCGYDHANSVYDTYGGFRAGVNMIYDINIKYTFDRKVY
jgi:hypothetical protein